MPSGVRQISVGAGGGNGGEKWGEMVDIGGKWGIE